MMDVISMNSRTDFRRLLLNTVVGFRWSMRIISLEHSKQIDVYEQDSVNYCVFGYSRRSLVNSGFGCHQGIKVINGNKHFLENSNSWMATGCSETWTDTT